MDCVLIRAQEVSQGAECGTGGLTLGQGCVLWLHVPHWAQPREVWPENCSDIDKV